jgi:hypothetical protein
MREKPRSWISWMASSGVAVSGRVVTSTRGTMISRTAVSPSSKILSIISASEEVTSASSGSSCRRSCSSSRETNWRAVVLRSPTAWRKPPTSALDIQVRGARSAVVSSSTRKRWRMRTVAHSRAAVLGMTSPKISMTGTRATVATKAAQPPATGRRAQVASEEAAMWATVTPIMAADRTRSGWRKASR